MVVLNFLKLHFPLWSVGYSNLFVNEYKNKVEKEKNRTIKAEIFATLSSFINSSLAP